MGPSQLDGAQARKANTPLSNASEQSLFRQAVDEADYAKELANPAPNKACSWDGSFDNFQSLSGAELATALWFGLNTAMPLAPSGAQQPQDVTLYNASYDEGYTGPYCPQANATLSFTLPQAGLDPTTIDPSTPFDINLALSFIHTRPNPQLDLDLDFHPANILRPFVVTDAWDPLDRVIFASDSFLALTGYTHDEVVGSNCRFLQSPDGVISPGAPRRSISSASAYLLKQKVAERSETEHSIINFKKSGEAFLNHLTLVPIPWGTDVATPRFLFGFANVFENSALLPPVTASCQSSLDTPSCLFGGDSSFASGQTSAPHSTSGCSSSSIPALDHDGNAATQGVEPMEWSPPVDTIEQKQSDDGVVPNEHPPDLIPCLQDLENITSATSQMPAWNHMLLENMDALVQVLSLKGNIAYASASHERLGYRADDLLGKPMDRLYHPSDVAVLMRQLKSTETSDLDLTLRLKGRAGDYAWYQSTGSIRQDGGRRWVTLTLFHQPVSRLSSRALRGAGSDSKHGLWFKLATSGLVLHLFDDPQKALGIPAEELVGTRLQDALIQQGAARSEFENLLRTARDGGVASSTLTLTSGRGHRLEANIVLHPGALGDRRQPYYLLAYCGILRPYSKRKKRSPPRDKKYSTAVTITTTAAATPVEATSSSSVGGDIDEENQDKAGNDDILEDLDANQCGSLGYEIHRLGAANQGLHEELQTLLKRASHRRSFKKHGILTGGCANCHTTVSPEWRRGPDGERNLCNRCGLRWAKTRRDADVDRASNSRSGSG